MALRLRKAEEEANASVSELDVSEEIQALLGRDTGAIGNEKRKLTQVTDKQQELAWMQVSKLKGLVGEIQRGAVKRTNGELLEVVDRVFSEMDYIYASNEKEYRDYLENAKEVSSLEKDVREGDKVRGFDLEEGLDLDLLLDLKKFEAYVGSEEQTMIDNYYKGCEMLKETRNLEIQTIEESDVITS